MTTLITKPDVDCRGRGVYSGAPGQVYDYAAFQLNQTIVKTRGTYARRRGRGFGVARYRVARCRHVITRRS
ncbi:hypothetical protein [Sodalis sp. (in: enterobacteria)]|uniref:hypothetical protein n=1 Tax=Sodalis sp. (in: enterobacteria) TaxID=1898979 RepID=UPI003F687BC7